MKIVKQLLTESDNETHDLYRYLALLSVVVAIGLSIYSVIQGGVFSALDFGTGIGALIGGVGIAIGLKK